ncbi:hypothetical protein D3C73_1448000 [compost metagenome]
MLTPPPPLPREGFTTTAGCSAKNLRASRISRHAIVAGIDTFKDSAMWVVFILLSAIAFPAAEDLSLQVLKSRWSVLRASVYSNRFDDALIIVTGIF